MNAQNAKDYLPLVQALAEGKTIQAKNCNGSWEDLVDPILSALPDTYRIKPDPRHYWVVIDPQTLTPHAIYTYKELAYANQCRGTVIEVIEVMK